jgi:hypothetical protein
VRQGLTGTAIICWEKLGELHPLPV